MNVRPRAMLLAICSLTFPGAPPEAIAAAPANTSRPNILFCIADDWSFPHAGAYGDRVVKTPHFDRIAREGALFNKAYCSAPSCSPSRAAILTGRAVHQLEQGANLWGFLPTNFVVYPDLLEKAGYYVGLQGKGWGPGNFKAGGRARNPAGPTYKRFEEFLESKPREKPFCFWFGSSDPHRPYEGGAGLKAGFKLEEVKVPSFLPDTREVHSDLLDYYFEVERMDGQIGQMLLHLEKIGLLENTLVVMTSDNGMPFPRAKANLYEFGTHVPLAISWPRKIKGGLKINEFVNLYDIAPTLLEAVGVTPPSQVTGRSLLGLLTGKEAGAPRDRVFLERERHANVRRGDLSYPSRAVRTAEYLYIRNLRPERWPAGDPEKWKAVGEFGDVDASPTKQAVHSRPGSDSLFQLCFGKRPAEELYHLRSDPHEVKNVAGVLEHAEAQRALRASLDVWMKNTDDPRAAGDDDRWDTFPYYGDTRSMPEPVKPSPGPR